MIRPALLIGCLVACACATPGPAEPDPLQEGVDGPAPGAPEHLQDRVAPDTTSFVGSPRSVPFMGGGAHAEGDRAAVSAPRHDEVWLVDLAGEVATPVVLHPHDVPARLRVSGDDVYVVLRGSGAIARIDVPTATVVQRRRVCPEPRDVETSGDQVFVSCAGGELLTLDRDLQEQDRWFVDADLRDLALNDDGLWASRFVSAEVLRLDPESREILARFAPVPPDPDRVAAVGWRLDAEVPGVVILVHQTATTLAIELNPDGGNAYDRPEPIVHGAISVFDVDGHVDTRPLDDVTLGLDVTWVPPFGLCVASAGQRSGSARVRLEGTDRDGACVDWTAADGEGRVVAVHHTDSGMLLVSRAPFSIQLDGTTLVDQADRSHDDDIAIKVFHLGETEAGIACASCHPEGQQDGLTWNFEPIGPRRTPLVAGRVLDRAPYHWDADMADLDQLMDDVFHDRMGGLRLGEDHIGDLGAWMHGLQPVRPAVELGGDAVLGATLFGTQGCAGCHAGPVLTDNALHTVGTRDAAIKTPSLLGVGHRGPWMHDGCAATLHDRFTDPACGGGTAHGSTATLTGDEIDALVAYLRTL